MTEPMKRGALARITRSTEDLVPPFPEGRSGKVYSTGFEFEVEDYVPDGKVNGKPLAFYWGNARGGMSNVCVPADAVEQIKSAEEMAGRKLPSAHDLLGFIASALLTEREGIEIDEVDRGGQVIEAFGKTEDGLGFGFSFPIAEISIWRTDD